MPTASLTTRIDVALKTELERIARFEKRSASFMTNQAIANLVNERRETRELIQTGLDLIEAGAPSLSKTEVHDWFMSGEDTPFPQAKHSR